MSTVISVQLLVCMTFISLVSLLHVQSIQSLSDAILTELRVNDTIPHLFEKVSLS